MHFTPTYSSWLNQVELWFAKIERDVIARGVFPSLAGLRRKLMKYIHHYNKVPKAVKWGYFDPTNRITPTSAVTGHQPPERSPRCDAMSHGTGPRAAETSANPGRHYRY